MKSFRQTKLLTALLIDLSLSSALAFSYAAEKPPSPGVSLNQEVRGQTAIDQLGTALKDVAEWHGKTESELKDQLSNDETTWIDTQGRIFFIEKGVTPSQGSTPISSTTTVTKTVMQQDGATVVSTNGVLSTSPTFSPDKTFLLHSRPGSKKTVYLDFTGNDTTGTAWNAAFGLPKIAGAPFDIDGVPGTFSIIEQTMIQNIWKRVSEDYAPFDVDVTTQEPPASALTRAGLTDDAFGIRVVITKDWTRSSPRGYCNCGGFAYLGSFDQPYEYYKPAFVFYDTLLKSEKNIAEAISHEVGHTVGLSHKGATNSAYYYGQGTGITGWAPIMGAGYNKQLTQWSKGEYAGANNKQDEFAIMQKHGLKLIPDDHGNTITTATTLTGNDVSGRSVLAMNGLIGSPADIDLFKFASGLGTLSIAALPYEVSPNLDIVLQLIDATGKVIAEANPTTQLSATMIFNVPVDGVYYLALRGTGKGNPLVDGYSSYGSVGKYRFTVSAPISAKAI